MSDDTNQDQTDSGSTIQPQEVDEGGESITLGSGEKPGDDHVEIPASLPILPIRNAVVFPGTVMPLQIMRDKSKRVLDLALAGSRLIAAISQRAADVEDPYLDDLYRVGTACMILKMYKSQEGTEMIIVHGLQRIGVESVTEERGYLEAIVHAFDNDGEITTEQRALMHSLVKSADRIMELAPDVPPEAREVLKNINTPAALADFLAANLSLGIVHKQELLETFDVTDRLHKVNLAVAAQLDVLELSQKIQSQVRSEVDRSQREYYLRQQMKAIRQELGEGDGKSQALDDMKTRIEKAAMPEAVEAEAVRELERMEHIPQASPEYSMALDYLEWLVEMPWSARTEDNLDLQRAEEVLDEDHYGLEKVKKRILEFLAVRTLKKDSPGPILCFAGPPGVGKTSLGQSISRAMGRKFIRVSLGGIRDEATIRGHRRTYIGAMPGRIVREIRRAETRNPLFMLDEVDKIGYDVRGDPMSALLEVLDPAQNNSFSDHYLAVPFDLSDVLFIATANYMSAIEPALRDRMEIIELPGYTHREKIQIARRHLLPRQLDAHGLDPDQVDIDDDTLRVIISSYTAEAGVRALERRIGAICRSQAAKIVGRKPFSSNIDADDLTEILGRKEYESEIAATKPVPGVVTGLAYTPVGGEILFVEVAMVTGSGELRLTGQLGDVMRESALAASSILRGWTRAGATDGDFGRWDTHVHVPAGAIPKDGPSAGVAILSAMTSALTGKVVDPSIGMTGEITLSGRVLPIGGVREKILAAHRAGLKTVILPAKNEEDLEDVPEEVLEQLSFVFVENIEDLLEFVFPEAQQEKPPAKAARKKKTKTKTKKKAPATRKVTRKKAAKSKRPSTKSTRAKKVKKKTTPKRAAKTKRATSRKKTRTKR